MEMLRDKSLLSKDSMRSFIFSAALLGIFALSPYYGAEASSGFNARLPPEVKKIEGLWLTQDRDGIVSIYECGAALCGKFVWLQDNDPAAPSLDSKNPNPEKRSRPLCGMEFMGDFKLDEDGKMSGGWIYSPRHGDVFDARLSLAESGALKLHGYLFVPLLGQTQTWTRVETLPPNSCPTS